ncbi:MAG: hypothetical protein ACI3X1_08140 [Eubacteriales bacterium]
MRRQKRALVLFFATLIIFTFVLSTYFITHESGHDCIGESCRICALISSVSEVLKNLSSAVLPCVLFLALTYIGYEFILCTAQAFLHETPVLLKVKLLN